MRSTVAVMAYTLIANLAGGIHLQRNLNRHQLLLSLAAAEEAFPGFAGGLDLEALADKIDQDGFFLPEKPSGDLAVFLMDVEPRKAVSVSITPAGFFTLVTRLVDSKEDNKGRLAVFPHLSPAQVDEYVRMTFASQLQVQDTKERQLVEVKVHKMRSIVTKQMQSMPEGGMFAVEPHFCIFKPRSSAANPNV